VIPRLERVMTSVAPHHRLHAGIACNNRGYLAPRISKLRYWSNEAQARPEINASFSPTNHAPFRGRRATATIERLRISCGTVVPSGPFHG